MNNQLRIIAGKWRGRKLKFVDAKGLRPTLDRVRETLFNWLQADIHNARCLDLYSGSGALGLEALSRGASHVTLVDNNRQVLSQLKQNLNLLACENVQALGMDAADFLSQSLDDSLQQTGYDIVFLDPPFHQGLLESNCLQLEQQKLLKEAALIYIETEKNLSLTGLPANWLKIKQKQAGQLAYYLFQREY